MKRRYNYKSKTEPFEHQVNAIAKIAGDHPVALFDEQGLGKTKMTLAGLSEDMEAGIIDCVLIVCKKTLIKTWENEIKFHTHLKAVNLTGDTRNRKKYLLTFGHFYIINYESLVKEEELLELLLQIKKFAIVLDEAHRIKDPNSQTSKSVIKLGKLAKKKVIITGTPVANKPEDLWSQFYFLDGGIMLGKDFKAFRKGYGIDISMGKSKINKLKLKELQHKIKEFAIRRLKASALPNLPKKNIKKIFVKLKGKQKEFYELLRDEFILEIEDISGAQFEHDLDLILKRLLRLAQIASNPQLLKKSYEEMPCKFKKIDELVKKIVKAKEKVIIWTSFVDNISKLKLKYKRYGALMLHGGMKISDRNKVVDWFQNDSSHKVLIANPAAAKEGLTLTAANHAIYLDRNFNVVDFLQSQDRIHRLSQKKECFVYIIIAKNTVDEFIENLLSKKTGVAQFIQGDSEEIILPKKQLTKEKLMQIIGGKKK